MYCYNCGTDCREDRFCSNCGCRVGKPEERYERTVNLNTEKGSAAMPVEENFVQYGKSLKLLDSSVYLDVGGLFVRNKIDIPYNQLTKVFYHRPPMSNLTMGALLVRGKGNENIPIASDLRADKAAVPVNQKQEILFYHVFCVLRALAPQTAEVELIVPQEDLTEISYSIDMEYYYNTYKPYRDRAVKAIREEYGISSAAAIQLVNRAFDSRQKLQYEADPVDAVRDLNLIIADRKRKEAEAKEKKMLEDIRDSLDRMETRQILEDLRD